MIAVRPEFFPDLQSLLTFRESSMFPEHGKSLYGKVQNTGEFLKKFSCQMWILSVRISDNLIKRYNPDPVPYSIAPVCKNWHGVCGEYHTGDCRGFPSIYSFAFNWDFISACD